MRKYTWTKGSTPPEVRIRARLIREYGQLDPQTCWIWPGAICGRKPCKYGMIQTGSRTDGTRRAKRCHVVMWEAQNGPTPDGLELHHRCMTSLCCNPDHVTPVTHAQNLTLVRPEYNERRRAYIAHGRAVYAARRVRRETP